MKNLSVALLAVAALSTSVANASNGFYLGASAGVAQTNAKYDFQNTNVVQNAVTGGVAPAGDYQQSFKADGGKAAGVFGLFAGYGAVVGRGAYVGGEIYAGMDTTSFSPYDDSASGKRVGYWKAKLEHKYYYGLAARLGYMITPNTLAYIRLAVESGKWKASTTPNGGLFDVGNVPASSEDRKTVTKNKTGIQFAPGVGVEVYVSKNMFIRAEYSYLFGPKLSLENGTKSLAQTLNGFNGDSVKHNFKTSQHAMKIGVGYKF
jgi:opacity protein-like surface antigen